MIFSFPRKYPNRISVVRVCDVPPKFCTVEVAQERQKRRSIRGLELKFDSFRDGCVESRNLPVRGQPTLCGDSRVALNGVRITPGALYSARADLL